MNITNTWEWFFINHEFHKNNRTVHESMKTFSPVHAPSSIFHIRRSSGRLNRAALGPG